MVGRDELNTQFAVLQTAPVVWHSIDTLAWSVMRLESLKISLEALDDALHYLETTRLTPPDDPKLSALKADIRKAIQKARTGKRRSSKTSRHK
jgi:hypothetical protein